MGLEERLRELLDEGATEMAESLSKGAIGSQDIIDFQVTENELRVETKSWIGTHTTRPNLTDLRDRFNDPDKDNPSIQEITIERSEYTLKSNAVDYTITGSQAHHDHIETYLEQKFCTPSEPFRSEDPYGESGDTETVESNADGESSPPSDSGPPFSDGGQPQSWHHRVIRLLQQYLPLPF